MGDFNFFTIGGCTPTKLTINDQETNIVVNSGTIVIFKVCGIPNIDFVIQDITGTLNSIDHIVDQGKLPSDGIYTSAITLNDVGTFAFQVGAFCSIPLMDYCGYTSNIVTVTVIEKGCTPNWQCRQPRNGYEYDANYCGAPERFATRCSPGVDGGNGGDSGYNILLKIGAITVIGIIIYYSTKK